MNNAATDVSKEDIFTRTILIQINFLDILHVCINNLYKYLKQHLKIKLNSFNWAQSRYPLTITDVQLRSLLVEKFGSSQECFRPCDPWIRPYGPRDPSPLTPIDPTGRPWRWLPTIGPPAVVTPPKLARKSTWFEDKTWNYRNNSHHTLSILISVLISNRHHEHRCNHHQSIIVSILVVITVTWGFWTSSPQADCRRGWPQLAFVPRELVINGW